MSKGLTEIRTQVSRFKVLSDNHYTIRPWFEELCFEKTRNLIF